MLNRKRSYFQRLAAAVLLPSFAIAQPAQNESYAVTGNLRGLKNDSVVLFVSRYAADGVRAGTDTIVAIARDGAFSLSGRVPKPTLAWMQVGGMRSRKSTSFFLERGRIVINGTIDSMDRLFVTGTPSNNDMTRTRSYTGSIYDRIRQQQEQLKALEQGSAAYKTVSEGIAARYDSINNYEVQFIRANPASQMSSIYLYVKQDRLPVDEVEKLYNSLTPAVRANDMVSMIPAKVEAKRSVTPGNAAPDFVSADSSGRTVKLSDFRGKYVLLDFWASWCVPCRKQSPELKLLYDKYAARGFTILQYSVDDKKDAEKWKAAIQKDGLTWPQVSDLAGLESPVSKRYGVQPIPDNFLIDPKGIILGRGFEPDALAQKLRELLDK